MGACAPKMFSFEKFGIKAYRETVLNIDTIPPSPTAFPTPSLLQKDISNNKQMVNYSEDQEETRLFSLGITCLFISLYPE